MNTQKQDMALEIEDLSVEYRTGGGIVRALTSLELSIKRGTALGLVGETGADKTTLSRGIMRLIPDPPGKIVSGQILFDGTDLLGLPVKEMRKYRGRQISMIFQEPMTSLNPLKKIGKQIQESIELNQGIKGPEAKRLAVEMLAKVGIPDPERRANQYPHEFSGGMRQRVVIAIAAAPRPPARPRKARLVARPRRGNRPPLRRGVPRHRVVAHPFGAVRAVRHRAARGDAAHRRRGPGRPRQRPRARHPHLPPVGFVRQMPAPPEHRPAARRRHGPPDGALPRSGPVGRLHRPPAGTLRTEIRRRAHPLPGSRLHRRAGPVVAFVRAGRGLARRDLPRRRHRPRGAHHAAVRIKDPSLHNWLALALAVRGEGISDFPICNKSFNLSYCGHDL